MPQTDPFSFRNDSAAIWSFFKALYPRQVSEKYRPPVDYERYWFNNISLEWGNGIFLLINVVFFKLTDKHKNQEKKPFLECKLKLFWKLKISNLIKRRLIEWPPRSTDLNPLDFFLWGHLKNFVY